MARQQTLALDTILVFDRGSLDFAWFARLTETGVFFVTRLKDGTAYDVIERHAVPTQGGVVVDEWIALRTPQRDQVRARAPVAPRRGRPA